MQQRKTKPDNPLSLLATLELRSIALLLDIDGTLLDIAPRPQDVRVPDDLPDILSRLAHGLDGALAFVSGRTLSDIDHLFAPRRFAAIGGHGAEMRIAPDGPVQHSHVKPIDDALRRILLELHARDAGVIVENKTYSVAVHYRLAPQRGEEIAAAVARACAGRDDLEILPGKAVIEIKLRGFDKGTALRRLMNRRPFRGRRPIFIGDDVTDDAAFAVLPELSGIGLSVGAPARGNSLNFEAPRDVRLWLAQLAAKSAMVEQ
jgi:trehalose 6-phosphate phosphatase